MVFIYAAIVNITRGLIWWERMGGGFFSPLVSRRIRVSEKRNVNWNSMNAPDEGPGKQLASYQYRLLLSHLLLVTSPPSLLLQSFSSFSTIILSSSALSVGTFVILAAYRNCNGTSGHCWTKLEEMLYERDTLQWDKEFGLEFRSVLRLGFPKIMES